MKPVLDSGLFIPCHLKLAPDLPLHLLADALHVDLKKITLITEAMRLEADASDFVPLSALLVSELNRDPVALELQKPRNLPDLKWRMPEGFDEFESRPVAAERTPRANRPPNAPDVTEIAATIQSQARDLRSSQDYLGAVLYYALSGDLAASAELFRQQAADLHDRDPLDDRGDAR